jgi:sugar phosphate permease
MFLTWTPKFLTDKFGFELTTAGLTGAVFIHAASALSVPWAGAVADLLGRRMAGGRILAQAMGLLVGAGFVALVGLTRDVPTLVFGMTAYGICKGFYDAGIFASLYDVVHPRARGTAAGLMNTVGWLGGALGAWLTGRYADRGPYGSKVENMSHFIASGGYIYLGGVILLLGSIFLFARRDVVRNWSEAA